MKKSFYFYTSIALLIILGLVIGNYIFGWTTPTANPPSSNLPAPINTGSSNQPKLGYLAVGTTTTPAYPLEVGNQLRVWGQLISKVASGTAPFVVDSQTKVANLNVDLLDGYDSSDLLGGGTVWGFSAPPGNCAPYNDCDGDGKTAYTGDCDESCSTCYVGSVAYTTTPDGKDQDCDGLVDEEITPDCTALLGSSANFGYDANCNWVLNGAYRLVSNVSAAPPASTHCTASGTECTPYEGGYRNCTKITGTYSTGYSRTCGNFTWRHTTATGPTSFYYSYSCQPLVGCTKTPKYQ